MGCDPFALIGSETGVDTCSQGGGVAFTSGGEMCTGINDPFGCGYQNEGVVSDPFDPTSLIDQTAGIGVDTGTFYDPNSPGVSDTTGITDTTGDPTFSTTVYGTDPSAINDLPISDNVTLFNGTCDPSTDPNCSDSGACDSTDPFCQVQFSPYDPSLDPTTVQWCLDNPNECDTNGPTTSGLSLYCTDHPELCSTASDGTVQPVSGPRATGGSTTGSGGTSGGGTGGSAGGGAKPSGASSSSNPLSGLLNALKNLFSTCPAGYVKTTSGTCVRSTTPATNQAGLLGSFGSNSTLLLIVAAVVVLAVIHHNKEG